MSASTEVHKCPCGRDKSQDPGTAAVEFLHDSGEFWDCRTVCCGADSTFIADYSEQVCRCCWHTITEWRE